MKIFVSNLQLLNIGGISSSLLNFLNELKIKNEITLCILSNYISKDICLPSGIKIVSGSDMLGEAIVSRQYLTGISTSRKIRMVFLRTFKRIFGIESVVNFCLHGKHVDGDYDVAIAFSNNLYDEHGKMGLGGDYQFVLNGVNARKKLAWIHNDAAKCGITRDIARRDYRDFDGVIHVSYNNKTIFDNIAPELEKKSFVIYNTYDIGRIKRLASAYPSPYKENGCIHFVTVCRLTEGQKRISRIFEAAKTLVKDGYTNFEWKIVGDGDDRPKYEQMLNEYNLTDYIELVGLKPNPYPYMQHAYYFVLTSLYEGFGMANVEAQILGTPALVTDYGAANEVVKNGINGIICENSVEGVVSMIKQVLDNPELNSQFRQYFIEHPVSNDLALKQFCEIATC